MLPTEPCSPANTARASGAESTDVRLDTANHLPDGDGDHTAEVSSPAAAHHRRTAGHRPQSTKPRGARMSANGHGSPNGDTPDRRLTTAGGAPVVDNNNVMTAGPRGPMLAAGRLVSGEAGALSPRTDPGTPDARQGIRRLRHVHRDQRHHPLHQGQDLLRDRQADRDVRPVLDGRRRTRRRRRRSATSVDSPRSSTPRRATGTSSATTPRSSSSPTR